MHYRGSPKSMGDPPKKPPVRQEMRAVSLDPAPARKPQVAPAPPIAKAPPPAAKPAPDTKSEPAGPIPAPPEQRRPSSVLPAAPSLVGIPRRRTLTKDTLKAFLPRTLSSSKNPKEMRKKLMASDFGMDDEVTAYDTLLGKTLSSPGRIVAQVPTLDGMKAAPGLSERQPVAVVLPYENASDQRSPAAYAAAIDQFAVATNARYFPDEGNISRAHLFVWDVSRAMGCEIPHFIRGRQQTLEQTCLWLREKSSAAGWVRVALARGLEHAKSGGPTVVVPRDTKLSMIGVLRPNTDPSGKPLIAAAGRRRGGTLSLIDAIGVPFVDCFVHP